jgi:RNA 3'-terminal phosphate cyclase (ATP)
MIEIDGSEGEGGGQILRSALSLAICTEQPFRIDNIRANRDKPGLMRQHLTAVKAAAEISNADVIGAEIGSKRLEFRPRKVKAGDYSFAIGTAGSCTLVLQTVLPPLLMAKATSSVRISGGTHNRACPPVDFLARSFLPLLARMGAKVDMELLAYGFYPRGGGEIRATIHPCDQWQPISLLDRGKRLDHFAEAYIVGIPLHVAERELAVIGEKLNWDADRLKLRGLPSEYGPGNAVTISIVCKNITEVFTSVGEKGLSAESVAKRAANEACDYLSSDVVVGEHLADQLLIPMAFGGVESFSTYSPTMHFASNAKVIEMFTGKRFTVDEVQGGCRVSIESR